MTDLGQYSTRTVDDLGRIVLPKELRKRLGINEHDQLDIFADDRKMAKLFVAYVIVNYLLSKSMLTSLCINKTRATAGNSGSLAQPII